MGRMRKARVVVSADIRCAIIARVGVVRIRVWKALTGEGTHQLVVSVRSNLELEGILIEVLGIIDRSAEVEAHDLSVHHDILAKDLRSAGPCQVLAHIGIAGCSFVIKTLWLGDAILIKYRLSADEVLSGGLWGH